MATQRMTDIKEYSKYTADRPRQAYQLALLGHTDREIARVMGIGVDTLDCWKRKYPNFREELERGKDDADGRVAEALYKRAVGCTVPDVHIALFNGRAVVTHYMRHYPPDVTAATRWLALRQGGKWSEVIRTEIKQTNVNITKIDLTRYTTEELAFIEGIQKKALMSDAEREN